ncbi:hypothetical protein SCLCIDRAFT_1216867 [Scleroderma citrinum Foug A]|uniref:Uncharacterized protein n=1 Tax=Scleroderma citrinum Foug A TaxID=1036808 RepID=A0A0C2ZFF7_9AGAM|nr:hypothetical protein SCLCIDRAFT_1216867 [Scleroderma citrinum Foug A]
MASDMQPRRVTLRKDYIPRSSSLLHQCSTTGFSFIWSGVTTPPQRMCLLSLASSTYNTVLPQR